MPAPLPAGFPKHQRIESCEAAPEVKASVPDGMQFTSDCPDSAAMFVEVPRKTRAMAGINRKTRALKARTKAVRGDSGRALAAMPAAPTSAS